MKRYLPLLLALAAVVAVALVPAAAMAQAAPNLTNAVNGLGNYMGGIVGPALKLAGVALIGFGMFEFFKASKGGEASGWLKGIVMLVVAMMFFAPTVFLRIFLDPTTCATVATFVGRTTC